MLLFHLLIYTFWIRFTLNCETGWGAGKGTTGKTGSAHSGPGWDSLSVGFLGKKTKPEADGAKWGLLVFPFMGMH